MASTLEIVRAAAAKRILYLPHAISQMSHPDRMISSQEVEEAVWNEEVIEDYPEDRRGHSCLMLSANDAARPVHVVCAPKADYLAVITAYLPKPEAWSDDFRRRRD